ncbi:MAG: M24 family metallopeptidase [Acidimicrobiales bacterium]
MNARILPGNTAPGRSLRKHLDGDGTPEFAAASREGHHLVLGPGEPAVSEWNTAGLRLPDLEAIRVHRLGRVKRQLDVMQYDGVLVMDPINIRYITDTTNMQLWVMHNAARYAFMSASGHVVLWDYEGCEFLSGHHDHVNEVRPAIGSTYFFAGDRFDEIAARWAADVADVIAEHCGPEARIAVDQVNYLEGQNLTGHGITIERGQEFMELARSIKSRDEVDALRCAGHACTATMNEMRERVEPGMTEQQVWAMLHEGNIRRGGEWIETQILASGPRTNPWFQEASSRVIRNGDILAYDTDLIGAYGMCVDISRTWVIGDRPPTAEQTRIHELAHQQIAHNIELLAPGASIRDITFSSWTPPVEEYRHYSCLFHGVGQCDEWPEIYFPHSWDAYGYDAALEPGMVLSVEAYVGSRAGGEGVKLEEQILVTESGNERLTTFPIDLDW